MYMQRGVIFPQEIHAYAKVFVNSIESFFYLTGVSTDPLCSGREIHFQFCGNSKQISMAVL